MTNNFTAVSTGVHIKAEVAPPTGSNTPLASPFNWLVFTNPGTIAAQTVTLPTTAGDGTTMSISNIAAITAFTFSPVVAGWTNGATLAAGQGMQVAYSTNLPGWFVSLL